MGTCQLGFRFPRDLQFQVPKDFSCAAQVLLQVKDHQSGGLLCVNSFGALVVFHVFFSIGTLIIWRGG